MKPPFTLGIEEEFQMVDRQTGRLCSRIQTILEKGQSIFGEQIKAEMLQSTVELISGILPDIAGARREMLALHSQLARLLDEEGMALVSAGTHPAAHWQNEKKSPFPRYAELEQELQDVARSLLIFGLHVHVGVRNQEAAVRLMNELRTWLPHLLALSSNSPFWGGRLTGLKSYRSVVWKPFPRSGVPEVFASWSDFDNYVQKLIRTQCIDNGKRIWWDIRPHPFFNTVEFRICDMPATFDDMIAIAALCQALVAKLTWLHNHDMETHAWPCHFIEENKWRVIHYGLDADVIDFERERRLSMRESLSELLDFVEDVVDDLGSNREMNHIREVIADPLGTGADRQIAVYQQTESINAVVHYLMEQTTQGITTIPVTNCESPVRPEVRCVTR